MKHADEAEKHPRFKVEVSFFDGNMAEYEGVTFVEPEGRWVAIKSGDPNGDDAPAWMVVVSSEYTKSIRMYRED